MRHAPPLVVGRLADRPVASLLIYALDTSFAGSIVFSADDAEHVVYFENGRPCQADSPAARASIERVLEDLNLVDPQVLRHARAARLDADRLCRFLVHRGYLSVGALAAARVQQLERRVRALIALPADVRYAIHPEATSPAPAAPCDPLPIIVDAIRARPEDYPLVDTLKRFGKSVISINPDAPIRELGLRFELELVNALREEPRTLHEIVEEKIVSPTTTLIGLYALAVTRCLQFDAVASTPLVKCRHTSTRRHDSYPPPRTSGFFEHRPRQSQPRRMAG